jgi:hypothetical protein
MKLSLLSGRAQLGGTLHSVMTRVVFFSGGTQFESLSRLSHHPSSTCDPILQRSVVDRPSLSREFISCSSRKDPCQEHRLMTCHCGSKL